MRPPHSSTACGLLPATLTARTGPQTVPQLARARPVSRQLIQTLVNGFLKDGLVATQPNPAHRKSSLIALTAEGKRELKTILRRETVILARIRLAIPAEEIEGAAATLSALRAFLESKEWSRHVAPS